MTHEEAKQIIETAMCEAIVRLTRERDEALAAVKKAESERDWAHRREDNTNGENAALLEKVRRLKAELAATKKATKGREKP